MLGNKRGLKGLTDSIIEMSSAFQGCSLHSKNYTQVALEIEEPLHVFSIRDWCSNPHLVNKMHVKIMMVEPGTDLCICCLGATSNPTPPSAMIHTTPLT